MVWWEHLYAQIHWKETIDITDLIQNLIPMLAVSLCQDHLELICHILSLN